jgi:hypothetical protein
LLRRLFRLLGFRWDRLFNLRSSHASARRSTGCLPFQAANAVAAGDFNGDGRLDLAIADGNAGVSVLLNTGDWRSFLVGGFPSPVSVGDSGNFSVTGYDAYGNLASNYAGAVHFTSSDGHAVLPADYTFTASDHGTADFSAGLSTAGPQSLTVSDAANPAATGSQAGIHVNPLATVAGPTAAGCPRWCVPSSGRWGWPWPRVASPWARETRSGFSGTPQSSPRG